MCEEGEREECVKRGREGGCVWREKGGSVWREWEVEGCVEREREGGDVCRDRGREGVVEKDIGRWYVERDGGK